ncbi:S-type Pyocin domain-containing protein, partial [Vibrio anguillarum]|nr:S-type Pyocin domain-containing protein [Vibrio anguillarum]
CKGTSVTYKAVRITELMAHEFAQIEGALDSLDKKALKAAIPSNFSVDKFIEQVEQGHWLLLNDSPVTPMLVKESNEMGISHWVLNSQTIDHLEPAAQKALLARTNLTGAVSGA